MIETPIDYIGEGFADPSIMLQSKSEDIELNTFDSLREEIITSLLADNSFVVEVNTATRTIKKEVGQFNENKSKVFKNKFTDKWDVLLYTEETTSSGFSKPFVKRFRNDKKKPRFKAKSQQGYRLILIKIKRPC